MKKGDFIWGLFGMLITMIFTVFSTGTTALLAKGILPGGTSKLAFAFFTSFLMNATFAPTFMYAHRISDKYLDLKAEGEADLSLTFLLPGEYRVIVAALLSMALGLILTLSKKIKSVKVEA